MNPTNYLLIGGGLASYEAIKSIRTKDKSGSITLVTSEPHLPYDRPPLTKEYVRGEKPKEELGYAPPTFYQENKVATLLGVRAEKLDPATSTVALSNGDSVRYEKLFIATGGNPVKLDVPGANKKGIHYLRTQDDSDAIIAEAKPGKRAIIIGAGFIGLELAASLRQRDVDVTVVEVAPKVWARFAAAGLADFVETYSLNKGVKFHTNDAIAAFDGRTKVSSVRTKAGLELPCDFVVVAIGIRPNVELAESAGLPTSNGIVVDEFLATANPNIYAGGDVANYLDPVFKKRRRVEHWGHAEYCGQVAGANMAGAKVKYDLVTYVFSHIFDLDLEFAGDESEHDQALIRGKLSANSFMVLYLKGGKLRAYFSINTSQDDFPFLQMLMRSGKDLSKHLKELQDPAVPVKKLL